VRRRWDDGPRRVSSRRPGRRLRADDEPGSAPLGQAPALGDDPW
jgi:hypothetical protein